MEGSKHNRIVGLRLGFACLLMAFSMPGYGQSAQGIYAEARAKVYQIRIIDRQSKEKAAIGSGFLINRAGLLATNFHVIAEAVHHPEKYRIELESEDRRIASLAIADFDVIHDLALVQIQPTEAAADADASETVTTNSLPAPLTIATADPEQGASIYALGNPFDLGHTIIPGTYNGLLEQSFYQRIHFSGSLNPGMSGGPTIDDAGAVVGVNVATAGNQISFLVPASYLSALMERFDQRGARLQAEDFAAAIDEQLYADQDYKYQLLLNHNWQTQSLGQMQVGADINAYFKCWGDSSDDDDKIKVSEKSCTSQDTIFVSRTFSTGAIDIQYAWLETDFYDNYRFNKYFGQKFARMRTRTRATEDDVTNYQCQREFVAPNATPEHNWRLVLCVRQYKHYRRLYDVLFLGSLLGESQQGLTSHFALTGVSKANADAFTAKFMALHTWGL